MINAVIFDIGRVILPIDWSRVIASLGLTPDEGAELGNRVATGEYYDAYERGDMSTEDFFKGFEKEYGLNHTEDEIRRAWMQLILPPFMGIDEVLSHLKQSVEVYALSNTNEAHSAHFMREFEVFEHFHEVYTSHGLQARKPEKEIFEKMLALVKKVPGETLFLDDLEDNIVAARELGMNAERVENSVDQVRQVLERYSLWKP